MPKDFPTYTLHILATFIASFVMGILLGIFLNIKSQNTDIAVDKTSEESVQVESIHTVDKNSIRRSPVFKKTHICDDKTEYLLIYNGHDTSKFTIAPTGNISKCK